tara:strand:- start:8042 stop:8911 length:870 start_codon:yes stop_codon:yes gene_type:complete
VSCQNLNANDNRQAVVHIDSSNRAVALYETPKRIISLAPSTTEILFELGLGKLILAVDDQSNFPAETLQLEKLGGFQPNIERIIELEPDLVVGASIISTSIIQQLERSGIPVWIADSSTIKGIPQMVRSLGRVLGVGLRAEAVATKIDSQINDVVNRVSNLEPLTVFVELDATDASKPYTIGPNNYLHDLIGLAGGQNVFSDAISAYPQVSLEQVIYRDPELIVLNDYIFGITRADIRQRAGWKNIEAVRTDRILEVAANLNDRLSRPGPRVGSALEEIARFIHPDAFR